MINVFQPTVGEDELEAVRRVFGTSWLGRGSECRLFEEEFGKHVGVDDVLLFNSCTSALYVGLKASGIGPSDEVIIPTIHFVGVMNAVLELGATPVLADVDPHTLNLLPSEIERLRTDKTVAVILLHYGGHPCEDIVASDLVIAEDAAGAVASKVQGKPCGTLGDVGAWSFDAMKTMTMGDGGALWMKNEEHRERARKLRYLGLEQESGLSSVKGSVRWWEYEVSEVSGRFTSNDILTAIGRIQLDKLSQFVERRAWIWRRYQWKLSGLPITLPPLPLPGCDSTYYLYWIQTDDRDALAAYLIEAGIYTTLRYYPLHRVFNIPGDFPNADHAADTTLNLPIHPALTSDDVDYICQTIRGFFEDRGW